MLGKLLKYDFRSMGKQFAFIWPAALVLALVNRFTFGGALESGGVDLGLPGQLATGLTFLVYWAIILAMMVLTLVFIIQRFFMGLLGDEGYLTHTLPVKTWQLIVSKMICGISAFIISILVALLSILIMIPASAADLLGFWPELFRALGSQGVNGFLAPLELLVLILLSLIQCCLHLYLAMAIGHLFSKNRIVMSVIAFLAINFAVSILFSSAALSFATFVGDQVTGLIQDRTEATVWGVWHSAVGLMILGSAAAAAVYFFFTERILRRRLNLE